MKKSALRRALSAFLMACCGSQRQQPMREALENP